jgi:hypothetical protein
VKVPEGIKKREGIQEITQRSAKFRLEIGSSIQGILHTIEVTDQH